MRIFPLAALVLGVSTIAAPTTAKPDTLPPMNNFDFAFYTCEGGQAFQMSYDSDKATTAKLTTSNGNSQYSLTRTPVANGVQFSGQDVTFWTDGSVVVLKGTKIPFNNCKLKSS
jgi:hypothetical protein